MQEKEKHPPTGGVLPKIMGWGTKNYGVGDEKLWVEQKKENKRKNVKKSRRYKQFISRLDLMTQRATTPRKF